MSDESIRLRRKPLPYTASFAIDNALMELNDAIKVITPLIYGKVLDPVEKAERLGQIVQHIYRAVLSLKEARAARPGENGNSEPS